MIHELFGGGVSATATLLAGERNPSNSIDGGAGGGGVLLPPTTQSPSTTTTVTATATSSASENQNLRCPRCDSSNTKFCYYNNYNLTQPRHFCKTCRRYWTKGGALRNVPIGGGCRKNRSISGLSNSSAAVKTAAAAKMKTVASEFINGRSPSSGSLLGHGHGFEIENKVLAPPAAAAPSQILWGSPQNNSRVLALLRASQSPNPNTVSGVAVKEEGNYLNLMRSHSQSHMVTEPLVSINSNGLLNNNRSYDGGVGNVLYSSFWRNNQDHQPQQQQNNGGFLLGEQTQYQNSGIIQGLYQKLRSSSGNNNYCSSETLPVFLGNVASNSSSISNNILESTSVAGGELGYWNPTLSWSDLPVPTSQPPPMVHIRNSTY